MYVSILGLLLQAMLAKVLLQKILQITLTFFINFNLITNLKI